MSYLDFLVAFIEQPRLAAKAASDDRPLGLGLLCFLIAGISLSLAQSVSGRMTVFLAGPVSISVICLAQILGSLLLAAVLHFLVDLSETRERLFGNAAGLWVLLGLSDLVLALALPVALILRAVSLDRGFMMSLLLLVLGLVHVLLKIRSIKDNYNIGVGKAFVILALPYGIALILIIAMISAAVVGVIFSAIHAFS